jgi:hypothetical protein
MLLECVDHVRFPNCVLSYMGLCIWGCECAWDRTNAECWQLEGSDATKPLTKLIGTPSNGTITAHRASTQRTIR